ncbi:acylphosphatase [Neosynechococcus sphagnicola sy1]|uniref:acylphosphatase n=1 Tax=Neosynechococcus sphagnicola sy1 TaxID=1497020 RepID=A0A098TSG6_9CYAN|nr:acylphosphatase [Neosynechococcus sphagnicola]KGF73718.1 acylphosphatase [Neosynechococcus sphagnicola sy1]
MSDADVIGVHIWITGKVQGVAYRAVTRQVAVQLGLGGWVRNLPDGRVEAVFEGDRQRVEQMLAWCRQGPPAAVVSDVTAEAMLPLGITSFQILP